MTTPSSIPNKEFIKLCELYGSNARLWLRKFANLLPEVCKRGLYKNANCRSIHEFAAKYSGMNRATVDQIILLDRNLEDKPTLRSLLEDYGWSKLRVVANVATKDTDKMWAEKVKKLTKSALEIYVQEWRKKQNANLALGFVEFAGQKNSENDHPSTAPSTNLIPNQPSVFQQLTDFPRETCYDENNRLDGLINDQAQNKVSTSTENWTSINIKLDPETEFKLRFLKQKLEKQKKEPITFNQVIKYMLEEIEKYKTDSDDVAKNNKIESSGKQRRNSIILPENLSRTAEISDPVAPVLQSSTLPTSDQKNQQSAAASVTPVQSPASRHIPAKIRRQITNRFQHHCTYPGCNRPADEFHHIKHFASYHQHDPNFMVSLCKIHHKFAHSGLIKNELEKPEKWEVKV